MNLMNQMNQMIRLMTFNIRNQNQIDGHNSWDLRRDKVASMIFLHKPDLAGFQEVLHEQLIYLDECLSDTYGWVGVGRDDGKEKGEYSPVFYRKDLFTVISHDTKWLSETPDVCGSIGWDAKCVRLVTHVLFQQRSSGKLFHFFNTHFDHMGMIAQRNSAMMIKRKAADYGTENPVIVMGDFNCMESDEAYQILTQPENGRIILEDAMKVSIRKHHGPTGTFHEFGQLENLDKIDYIFTNDRVKVLQHGILADHWDGAYPSDHMPVIADILLV
ncbi:MAG: endonuclease/exonuclease/phosphatase family protein [Ruminiclostridium sp.]|nr:endonuclease/exonuclease/phosphatase family protein [Ruminiclostridium sp.]